MISQVKSLASWQPAQLPGAVTIYGKYVTLEPLSAELHAIDLWQAVQGKDEVWTWLADGPYSSETEFQKAIEAKQTGAAAYFFAILPAEPAEPVEPAEPAKPAKPAKIGRAQGYASLMRVDPPNGVIEVGNILFAPALQRTPSATEAIYLLARHIFEDLNYRRFEWKCNAANLPSRKAAERYGFTFEGIFRQHMIVKSQNRDTAWFSMLDSEWPARKQAFEAWLAPANFDQQGQQKQPLARPQADPQTRP